MDFNTAIQMNHNSFEESHKRLKNEAKLKRMHNKNIRPIVSSSNKFMKAYICGRSIKISKETTPKSGEWMR